MTALVLLLAAALVSFAIAKSMSNRLVALGMKSFTWGYYQSCILVTSGIGVLWYYVDYTQNSYYSGPADFLWLLLVETILVGSAVLNFRRRRVGAIAVSILNLNPISWVINWTYYKKRWNELRSIRDRRTTQRSGLIAAPRTFSIPVAFYGKWQDQHHIIQLGKSHVNIFRSEDGVYSIPADFHEQWSESSYRLTFRNGAKPTNVQVSFDLTGPETMRLKIEEDGNIAAFAECLRKVPAQP